MEARLLSSFLQFVWKCWEIIIGRYVAVILPLTDCFSANLKFIAVFFFLTKVESPLTPLPSPFNQSKVTKVVMLVHQITSEEHKFGP